MGTKIKELDFKELVAKEQAANIVRKSYEDKIAMLRGIPYTSLTESEKKEISQKLTRINGVRLKILAEMEKRLLNIEYDD